GGLQLLGEACAARDRAESLAEAIARDGAVVYSRAGVPKSHPAVKDELAARALVIRTPGTAGHHDGSDQADAWTSAAGEVLMPTNRRPLQRLRHPAFPPSVLKLFAELEAMPRRRRSEAYTRKSKELARLLDLTAEWWGMNDVNMRATRPSHPPGYASHDG